MDIVSDAVTKYLNFQEQTKEKDVEQINQIEKFNNNEFNKDYTDYMFNQLYNFNYNTINLYNDLEIFVNYDGTKNKCIFNLLNKSKLEIGGYYLKTIVNNPLTDYDKLTNHNNILKGLNTNYDELNDKIVEMKEAEKDIIWLLNKNDENEESIELYETLYFNVSFLQFMNDNELFLNIYYIYTLYFIPFINVIMPALSYVVPFILLKLFRIPVNHGFYNKIFKNVIDLKQFDILNTSGGSLIKYGGMAFALLSYLQTAYFCYKDSCHIYKVSNLIHQKINNMYLFIKNSVKLNKLTNHIFNDTILENPLKELEDELFSKEPYLLSNKGKILRVFKVITNNRFIFNNIILNTGKIDAYLSILRLKKEYNLSYPIYQNNNKPSLILKNVYHPIIDNPVKNSLYLNKDKKHILVTGANACGKSTFIKSISINILLAQTLGVCFATKMKFTPFVYFNTYLNLADALGKESLFQSEMMRMLENINIVKQTDKPVYLGIDEIFSSTNPMEATSGGYAICKEFSKNKNLISVISTHFSYLTNLEKDTKTFINYKFMGEEQNNKIKYNYKLEKGISNQTFALKLLEKNGYDKSIIKCAENTLDKIREENREKKRDKCKNREEIK
jgi:DNA mismatch repair ATPase MutS